MGIVVKIVTNPFAFSIIYVYVCKRKNIKIESYCYTRILYSNTIVNIRRKKLLGIPTSIKMLYT